VGTTRTPSRKLAAAVSRQDRLHVTSTATSDELEIARAAWRILATSGGVIDRPEIGRRYGLTRARTHALTKQRHFPKPVTPELAGHPLWLTLEVERYFASPRRPGRPRKDDPLT
jgi:predicted DNA-binding transcriptional regulator AlpA